MPGYGYSPKEIYAIYDLIKKYEPSRGISGVYALKSGYHSSLNDNRRRWPGNYSTICPADNDGPANAAAAIDFRLSDAAMKRVTRRLIDACRDGDPRMTPVREVLGTLNGRVVIGWNRVATGNSSRSRVGYVTSDSTHLWHEHISFLRRYVEDEELMKGVAEVICGVKPGTFTNAKPRKVKPKPKAVHKKMNQIRVMTHETHGHSQPDPGSKVVEVRQPGFEFRAVKYYRAPGGKHGWVKGSGGAWYRIYASKPRAAAAAKPAVDLSKLVAAAKRDPKRSQGKTTEGAVNSVKRVEKALRAEGLLDPTYASDGAFGALTVDAYHRWQLELGYRGKAADGIPGRESLLRLGKKHGFTVTN